MWLETDRGYSVNSRNQRMCAVKSFLRYAAEKDKILMPLFLDVKVIPKKKDTRVREIEFFSESALKAILEQPDRNKKNGQRDLFFMILMYDTGARAQEILDLRLCNIRMDGKNPYVVITGKGAKTRNVPIMEKTCKHLKSYLHRFHIEDNPEEYLFYIERKGIRSQMSIDNVEKFVARYGKKHRRLQQMCQSIYIPICGDIHVRCICIGMVCHSHWWPNGLDMQKWIRQCVLCKC